MAAASSATATCANFGTGHLAPRKSERSSNNLRNHSVPSVSIDRPDGRFGGIIKLLRTLWPAKASLEFHLRTGASIDHSDRVLNGRRGLSLEYFQGLVFADEGEAVLLKFMEENPQPYWAKWKRALEIVALEERLAALKRGQSAAD